MVGLLFGTFLCGVLPLIGCFNESRSTAPRSDAYFAAHIAAAEYRIRAADLRVSKPEIVPASLYEAAPVDVEYTEARRRFYEEKKPMLIIIHAEWCGPCHRMIARSIPRVSNLDKVSLVYVDIDADPETRKKLTEETSIPQVILFYHDKEGVARRKSVSGAQSAEQLEELIDVADVPDVQK